MSLPRLKICATEHGEQPSHRDMDRIVELRAPGGGCEQVNHRWISASITLTPRRSQATRTRSTAFASMNGSPTLALATAASAMRPISRTRIVQSWDVAMMTGGQNDYSACTTWLTHKNDAYLLHVYRGRLE